MGGSRNAAVSRRLLALSTVGNTLDHSGTIGNGTVDTAQRDPFVETMARLFLRFRGVAWQKFLYPQLSVQK
jgi:hypothetical protein